MDPLTLSAAAGVWLWDKYGKEFVDKLGHKAKGHWTQFNWQKAADSYRQPGSHSLHRLDCLKVAYVTNRAEIEAGLLLPPERKGG